MNSNSSSHIKTSLNIIRLVLEWLILLALFYILILLVKFDANEGTINIETHLDVETQVQLNEIHSYMIDLKKNWIDIYEVTE